VTERPQFNYIDAPLSTLAFRDEGLGFPDLPGKLHLRKSGPFAGFTENLEENSVTSRVDGFFHLRFVNATESEYKPKIE